jgi:hypothetical protein
MDPRQFKTDPSFEDAIAGDNEQWQDEDPVVTINRKNAVSGYFIAACVLSFVFFAGSLTLFRVRMFRDIDGFMMMLLGVSIASACAIAAIWIRARWVCVAVLDETGVIASTLADRYDLTWSDLVGARSYTKILKESNRVQGKFWLLLEECRCLEAPVSTDQLHTLFQILLAAKFKPESDGQRLGVMKGLTVSILGVAAMALGTWWAFHAMNQFNNGVLFQGNIKAILFKIAAATLIPIGGLIAFVWGVYHIVFQPILYKPGYLP